MSQKSCKDRTEKAKSKKHMNFVKLTINKTCRHYKKSSKLEKASYIFLVLAALVYTPHVYARAASNIQTAHTPSEVQRAYDSKAAKYDDYIAYEKALLATGLIGEKIGTNKTSVCYIETINGGGWTVAGYDQLCYLRVTIGYYTAESMSTISSKLRNTEIGPKVFDEDFAKTYPNDCQITDFGSSVTIRYVKANATPSTTTDNRWLNFVTCGRPSYIQTVGSVHAPANGDLSIKVIERINEATIDNTKNQVWIEADYHYFDQSIVCKPVWIPILSNCDLSRDNPVQ